MPSDTTNPQTTPSSSSQPPLATLPSRSPSNGKVLPTGNLDLIPSAPGESPLDFLRKNSTIEAAPTVPATPQKSPQAIFEEEKERHAKESAPQAPTAPAPAEPQKRVDPSPNFEAEKTSAPNAEKLPEADPDDAFVDEVLKSPESPAKESFKKLHTKLKATSQTLKEKEAALAKTQKDLEAINTGKVLPEVLEQREAEIKRLSTFEKLYNLKASSEYQEKFVAPINAKKEKLKNIFSAYEIPPEHQEAVLNQALNFKSEKELNNFLAESFDHIAALEVKGLINEVKNISSEAKAAEAEPARVLQELTTRGEQIRVQQDAQRKTKIYETAKTSWTDTVNEIRNEGKVLELIPTQDEEFNSKIVNGIMTQAATDYQAFVKQLTEAGAKDIPQATLKALARATLLSLATGVAVETRSNAVSYADSLEKGASRLNGLLRPSIGGGIPRSAESAPKKATTPEQDAQAITQSILAKRR